jgi:hypothetical protein
MGATLVLSSAAHPTSACYLQMGHHLKGNYEGFPTVKDLLPKSIVTTEKKSTKHKFPYFLC